MDRRLIKNRYLILIVIVGIIFPIDQLTKLYIDRHLELNQSLEIIENFFNISYIRNSGAAFGLLGGMDNPFLPIFFISISFVAIILILVLLRRIEKNWIFFTVCLSLILAGALGNMVDRIFRGEVIDFLDFYIFSFHWPAFNVADSAITVGGLLLFFHQFHKMIKH
jgi:signal peptidase II